MSSPIVVFGFGAVGRAATEALIGRGSAVRVAQRSRPTNLPRGAAFHPCDVLDSEAVRRAADGTSQVVVAIGFPYVGATWRASWPPAMENLINACEASHLRMVFVDNLYMYGPQHDPLREDITFASQLGSFQPATANLAAGSAGSTFTAGAEPGPAGITVGLDGEQVAVPLTVVSPPATVSPPPSPPTPEPTPPPAASEPEMESPAKPVTVQGSQPTVGTISCGEGTCQVDSKAAVAKLGGKSFKLKVIVPATISAGSSAAVKVVLPKAVRKALAKAGTGTIKVTIAVVDANGQTVTQTITVKIKEPQKK